jgi:penicillin-binding protein 1A
MNRKRLTKKSFSIFVFLMIGSACGASLGAFFALTHDLPQIRSLENFRPDTITRIYSADNVLLTELFVEKREPVPITVIPEDLKKALVTTEDRKFFQHSGVDLKGIMRAIIKDLWAGEFVEGASTITQQLAKTLFLTPRKTLVRKLKEAILAFQLERRYTKNEILELYLNQIYFGSGAYGVQSAASIFFGKSLQDLTLAESALIAAMPKSPSRFSPLVNAELAVKRRNVVLRQMHSQGIIDQSTYAQALNEQLHTIANQRAAAKAPYFVDYVRQQLEEILGSAVLYKGGLSVYTTLDFTLQQSGEVAIANGLKALEARMQKAGIQKPHPQAALIAIDVQSGGIVAMIGGRNFAESTYNRTTNARRQPGSAFKPIVYACAIEKGMAQNKLLLDTPVVFKSGRQGKDWKPENFSHGFEGEMTMRRALAVSQNIPAVRLIEMLGPQTVVKFARRLGIESHLGQHLSLALGSSEVSLIELTSAFTVFANRGEKITPMGIVAVLDNGGRTIWRAKPQKRLAMSRSDAAIVTNMLEAVVKEGTGKTALRLGRPIAGKTGTSNGNKDALFIGFSPSVAAGVWVGNDFSTTLGPKETGARAALPIWIEFMSTVLARQPHKYFDFPDDVVRVPIHSESGSPAHDGASNAVVALFRKGTEPKH